MGSGFSSVKEGFESFFNSFSLKTWVLIGLFVVCFLLVVFFQVLGLAVGVCLIFAVIVVLILRKNSVSASERKGLLLRENKEAERRFLKHLIDEKTFKKITSENEKRIIGIEAGQKVRESISLSSTEGSALSLRKRHKLKELLDEKQTVSSELELARARFFKHKIDEKAFQEISSEKQTRLVELATQISDLYRQEAQEIMQETARKLKTAKDYSGESSGHSRRK